MKEGDEMERRNRILIVDDDRGTLEMMQEALEPAVEDAELEEGAAIEEAAMEEAAVVDDEPKAVEADPAEDTELAPEWEEDQGA